MNLPCYPLRAFTIRLLKAKESNFSTSFYKKTLYNKDAISVNFDI